MATLAPMPSPRVRTATTANVGFFQSILRPNFRSRSRSAMCTLGCNSRTADRREMVPSTRPVLFDSGILRPRGGTQLTERSGPHHGGGEVLTLAMAARWRRRDRGAGVQNVG